MKKAKALVLFLVIMLSAQMVFATNILVVDDDNNHNNESRLYTSLRNGGWDFDIFDTNSQLRSPTSTEMSDYELVIWFTGSDGGSTYFWNGTDSDNPEVISFLDNGGSLWLYGIDVLYDRFGGAADTFAVGDFMYDYMGIASYDAQSHTGDDAGGVPQLDQTSAVLSTVDPIVWNYASLYYVDGVTVTDSASSVSHYQMGPDTYVYAGLSTVQSNTTEDFTVLSSFFKNWNFDTSDHRDAFISDVIVWFGLESSDPSSFTLVTPVDETLNVITDMTSSIDFTWTQSVDPDTDAVYYSFSIVDASNNEIFFGNYNDTTASVPVADLMPLGADTLYATWYVRASDGLRFAMSDTFDVAFTVDGPLPPQAFSLIAPIDDAVFTNELDASGIIFSWEEAIDPNDDAVTYNIYFKDVTGTLIDSVTALTLTEYTMSLTDIETMMTGNGYYEISWYVVASDGGLTTATSEASVVFSNQEMTILVVDDDGYQNYEYTLYNALDGLDVAYDAYDFVAEGSAPTADYLANYDLVIWYSGNDGGGLGFWNGADEDNEALKTYLDNGGNLWVNGLDLMYDRYGSAPDDFQAGDFVYDYMGISSYIAQSKADDGGLGAPEIDAVPGFGITSLDTITWRFSTAWYIDGVDVNHRAFSNYVMGPSDYALTGMTNVSTFIGLNHVAVNSFFNLNHINNATNISTFVSDMLGFFATVNTGDSPTAFTEQFPVDGDTLDIFIDDTDDVTFSWDASTDTETATVTYRFVLGTTIDNVGNIMVEDITDTHFILTEDYLYSLLPVDVDTLDLVWQALAYDEEQNITEAPIRNLTITRDFGSAPFPFTLVYPSDNTVIRAHEDTPSSMEFVWSSSVDPFGLAIDYLFEIMTDDSVLVYSATQSADTTIELSSSDFLTILDGEEDLNIIWNVTASNDSTNTVAFAPMHATIIHANPQAISILVVDDDNRYNNEDKIYNPLAANYYEFDTYDCAANDTTPSFDLMASYDFVIWFAGSDGVGLYFWDGNDSDNSEVISYLNAGGRLWVYGQDILYDRYGGAADAFNPGDFMYDYMGTSMYRFQSWANDDNVGVASFNRDANTAVTDLDNITWNTSTGVMKYADGCDLAPGTVADLRFGGSEYVLEGAPTSYHHIGDNFITMASWFNPYYMTSDSVRNEWVGGVVDWFENTMTIDAISQATLGTPAVETALVLNDFSDDFNFTWTNVDTTAYLYYQLVLETEAGAVVIPSEGDSAMVIGYDMYALAGTESDTLSLTWSVVAQTAYAGISYSETRTHTFIENINEAPSLFTLLEPVNEDTLILDGDSEDAIFTWTPSIDPDGDEIIYNFLWIIPGDTLFNISTMDTSVSLSAEDMDAAIGTGVEAMSYWKVIASDGLLEVNPTPNYLYIINNTVGVDDVALPTEFMLNQNYPNPFNPTTTIQYALPEQSDVRINIFDIRGRMINTLVNNAQPAGYYNLVWNGINQKGAQISTGVYFARIEAGSYSKVIKMVYLK